MRVTIGRTVFPLLAVVAAAVGMACGSDGGSDSGRPSDLTDPQVLNVNLTAEPQSLDPQRASDAASLTVVTNLYSGLLRLDPDLALVADLAEEVPSLGNDGISEDGLTYTFHLKDDLKWNDGTPLVAQAFVDGARRLFEPGNGSAYVDFYRMIAASGPDGDANVAVEQAVREGVQGDALVQLQQAVADNLQVEAPDEQTVVFRLNRPSPVFLLLATLWPLYPVRADVIESAGPQWTEPATHVSNGPFRLAAWNHNQDLQLTRNEHWHGQDIALETINFDMIDDIAVAMLAYQNNELDVVTVGPAQLAQIRGDAALAEQFHSYAQLSTTGIYFNVEHGVLQDERVRQALAGAINREEFAEAVTGGAVLPAFGWIPPGMPGHDEGVGAQYDDAIEDSKELLAEAGYENGEGISITILAAEQTPTAATAQWLQQQWQQNLGITVNIDVREVTSYLETRQQGDFDVLTGGWSADYPDPQNWLPLFRTGHGFNVGRFSDPEFDAIIDEADTELDYDDRVGLYMEAQRLLIDKAPFTPLSYGRRNILVKPWVQNLGLSTLEHEVPGDIFFDQVWINGRE